MTGKLKLYIGLLVLGLVAVGVGIWLVTGYGNESAPEDLPVTIVNIPEGEPVIYERVNNILGGENRELYIYGEGSIIYIEEKGLRFPSPPATRTWKTGRISAEQLSNLLTYLENSGLDKLEDQYNFPGIPKEDGGIDLSDVAFTVIVISDSLSKKVSTFGYLSPDNGETYPDMPSPLNEIYIKLRAIALETEEVYREDISD